MATGGTLYVVATPIGNLGDVTFRALEVLRDVPLIAAEDTRITRRLLDRYAIPTRTVSYHAQSGPARERELLDHLASGADLALVTDAGTPVVSRVPLTYVPFMTPISSPVNTLVVGPGQYSFGDFVKVGVPFTVVVAIVSVLLVPVFLRIH